MIGGSGVINELERIRNRFFWGLGESCKGKMVWVKWEKVISSFEDGGLNIGDLSSMNIALLGKWWWRFLFGENSLWTNVIRSIYGLSGGLWEREERMRGLRGGVWSKIIKIGEVLLGENLKFENSFRKKVGEGVSTSFWKESWISEKPLMEGFPRLFRLESSVDSMVADRGRWENDRWEWVWSWRREPRGREVGEFESLRELLRNWEPRRGRSDVWEWKLDVEKGFTVKKCRECLVKSRGRCNSSVGETLWNNLVPRKVNILMWRARLGRLPTRVALNDRGIDLDSVLCPRCEEEVESLDHALVNCKEVKNLWIRLGKWWNKKLEGVDSFSQLIQEDTSCIKLYKNRSLWISVKWAVVFLIWQDRNNLIFKSLRSNLGDAFFVWQRLIFEWLSSKSSQIGDWYSWLEHHARDSKG
ncbi:hypothetical protein OSB04_013833 [Centaurea solstitialis]|uniref:Reverse transcriptase zinc-binding domain-containing protein n=1 Tax=Centaurea solstitialis TaxID=347529 RepID=A0AA38WQU9_9ASTR|nr:hypothetical protein OSB04_013833 [Centaurea solstitialis]